MASFPYWLGTPPITSPNNSITIDTQISTINLPNTTVNIVPQVVLFGLSTATLNTANPSEILSYTLPETGFYNTQYNGAAFHSGSSNWSSISQLDWYAKKNGALQSNTATIVKPQFICGDSVSEFISLLGGGVFFGSNGDVIEWTTDGNTGGGPAITTGFNSGFSWITIQKIG